MNIKKLKTLRFFDILLSLAVIITAVLIIIFGMLGEKGKTYTVSCDGAHTEYDLSEARILKFESNGIFLTVECDGEQVWVSESDCPDKICVHSGKASRSGQIIVCSPGHFSVSIVGEGGDNDAVTG